MTITRTTADSYAVVTGTMLSNGMVRSDDFMALSGAELYSIEQSGHIRIGGTLRIKLGPKSFAKVQALNIGETLEVCQS